MTSNAGHVPSGYVAHFRKSPLTEPWEPLFSKIESGAISLGVRVRPPHCNGRDFVHGGLICALADNAMGLSVVETLNQEGATRSRHGSTVHLGMDYLASAQPGQWLEFVPRVLKAGSSLAFAECRVVADGNLIARGNATFRVYQTRTVDRADA